MEAPLFIGLLLACALLGLPMLYAVIAGLVMFFLFGLGRGISAGRLFRAMVPGFRKSLIVVVVILLMGAMSAAWRASGLMALLVAHGLSLIYAPLFLLFAFLLCAGFSFILGSSLGAASVMGILVFTLGRAGGVAPLPTAGAILSGIYFGDRASFLSSSALLVSTLCRVEHRAHLRAMQKSAVFPFLASAALYALLCLFFPFDPGRAREVLSLREFFELGNPLLWLPLAFVFLPAFTRISLPYSIALSAIAASALAIGIQGVDAAAALRYLIFGFSRPIDHPQLSLLYGGGLLSMVKPMLVVFFSGALPPLLKELGTLGPYQDRLAALAAKSNPFAAALASGIAASAAGCSQTLAVFLQAPLLEKVYPEGRNEKKALAMGNSSILISALVPWNIAMAAPLAIIGASAASGLFAFYLYLTPFMALAAEARHAALPGSMAGGTDTRRS
ncbi:MAG TPA: Na+/H+ antiporter NhaC family protein [Rectinemataceae bacterium]